METQDKTNSSKKNKTNLQDNNLLNELFPDSNDDIQNRIDY